VAAIGVGLSDRRIGGTRGVILGVLRDRKGKGREGVVRNWRGRRELTIGVVVRLNRSAGGVEVGESALIRAVEGCRTLLDNELLL